MTKGERMFNELGYKRTYCSYSDGIVFENEKERKAIEFSIGLKFTEKFHKTSLTLGYMPCSVYSIEEINAINQVYKENVWQIKLWGIIKYGNPEPKE